MPAPADTAAPLRTASTIPVRAITTAEQQLLHVLDAAGIANANERAMFLAQMSHETQDFRQLRENLRYSGPRLLQVFPGRFRDLDAAEAAVRAGPDAVAESLYGGRADLGNTHAGDGSRYIGRGHVHLTGRANYEAAGAALGLDLLSHPELAEDPKHAARIALWFWRVNHIGPHARRGDVRSVTQRVNGGVNGLADRQRTNFPSGGCVHGCAGKSGCGAGGRSNAERVATAS